MIFSDISFLYRDMPIVRSRFLSDLLQTNVYLKLEGLNPVASHTARLSLLMLDAALQSGKLTKGCRILARVNGNLAVALAGQIISRGYKPVIIVDNFFDNRVKNLMEVLHAEVYFGRQFRVLTTGSSQIADPHDAEFVQEYCRKYPDTYVLPEPDINRGAQWICEEILEHFVKPPVCLVTPVQAVFSARYIFRAMSKLAVNRPYYIAADMRFPGKDEAGCPEESADRSCFVTPNLAITMVHLLARKDGILLGGSSASVLAALLALRNESPRQNGDILLVCPDVGFRYMQTFYNAEWLSRQNIQIYPDIPSDLSKDLIQKFPAVISSKT